MRKSHPGLWELLPRSEPQPNGPSLARFEDAEALRLARGSLSCTESARAPVLAINLNHLISNNFSGRVA